MDEREEPRVDDVPGGPMLEAMAAYLTEAVEVVDATGTVLKRLSSPDGVLGHGRRRGSSVFANVHPDDLPRVLEFGTAVIGSEPGWQGTIPARLHHADGSWRTYEIHVVNHLDDPRVNGVIVRTRALPTTGPIVMEADPLDFSGEAIAESIAEAVPMALLVLSPTGRVEFANEAARRLCDLPAIPSEGWRLPELATEGDRATLTQALEELSGHPGTRAVVFEVEPRRAGDAARYVEARFVARGMEGRPSTIIALCEDVTARRREVADLRHRATVDPLTGVLNRAAILDEIDARLQRGPVTAIYCDLDGFKLVNDTLGHAAGDRLLEDVAAKLTAMVRPTDVIGRIGGDEFIIVCDGLVDTDTTALITRLSAGVDAGHGVEISIGVAGAEQGGSGGDLLERADRAMYDHKRRTRAPHQITLH